MAKNFTEDLNEFIENHADVDSCTELAKLYLKENKKCEISLQVLSKMFYSSMYDEANPSRANEININITDKDNEDTYVIDGDKYKWESRKVGQMTLPIKFADDIFYEYSKHGLNMSQDEVRRKHKLSIQQWNSIKCTLGLFKSSNIFSPYTIEQNSETELAELISRKLEMKGNDEYRIIEREYTNHTLREYKKTIRNEKRKTFATTEFLDDLYSIMPKKKILYVKEASTTQDSPEEIYAMVTDLHIGAKTEGLLNTPNYDRGVIETRLRAVADAINARGAQKVRLCILGDIIESFTGMNHINSYQAMDGSYFSKLFFQAYDILTDFFQQINNLKTINIIGGNHDRATPDNKLDWYGTIAGILSGMFEKMYDGVYEVNFSDLVLCKDFGNAHIIMAHGDKKIIKTEMLQASIRQFCDQNKMNYVFTGHLHSRSVKIDKADMRWYLVPAIFSGNYYSEMNGWNSKPGFFLLEEINGQLAVTDYPLPILKDEE